MNNEIVTQKECTKCKEIKIVSAFSKCKSFNDGMNVWCKPCVKAYNLEYYRSKTGVVSKIYGHQKQSAKHRKMHAPSYTKENLRSWLFSQKLFHTLHESWVKTGYERESVPSVDRKDDYLSYTLDNIQLMSWGENKNKGNSDRKNGINNKESKAVIQFDKNGVFIAEYHSIRHAGRIAKTNNSNIGSVCTGERKTAGGFRWQYK